MYRRAVAVCEFAVIASDPGIAVGSVSFDFASVHNRMTAAGAAVVIAEVKLDCLFRTGQGDRLHAGRRSDQQG